MDKLSENIRNVIDQQIRPKIGEHGGNIELLEIKDGVVYIKLTGNCSGCPSAQLTTENIVEATLREHLGDCFHKVVLRNEVSEDLISMAKKILNKSK